MTDKWGISGKIYYSIGPTLETMDQILQNYEEVFQSNEIEQGLRENVEKYEKNRDERSFRFWGDIIRHYTYREKEIPYLSSRFSDVVVKQEENVNLYFFFSRKEVKKYFADRLSQILDVELQAIDLHGRLIIDIARRDATRITMGWWKNLGERIDASFLKGILMDNSGDNELMKEIDRRANEVSFIQYVSRSIGLQVGLSSGGLLMIRGGDATHRDIINYFYNHIRSNIQL